MPKIVILGSLRFDPYIVTFPIKEDGELWNTEEGYQRASQKFYPAIDEADIVLVWAPDGIGDHTKRDMDYARLKRKRIRIIS